MKKLICSMMVAFFATTAASIAAPDNDAMMAKENAAWQAFRDKKSDEFKKLLAADIRCVYASGVANLQSELADMQKWDMKSFKLSDYSVVAAGDDTIVSTYKVTIEGTVDGHDASGRYNAASVWKKQNGEWRAIFHTNIRAGGSAPPES